MHLIPLHQPRVSVGSTVNKLDCPYRCPATGLLSSAAVVDCLAGCPFILLLTFNYSVD